ncbi:MULTISPECIES: polyribonucleotide nucleotidyltransferase [Dehalobacter]|uniref:Polyribonucleotide nucleotidyltransferase n=2 Tax=Dehalobacter restrictus TaxID=55583 RepID=A0A857DHG3_9FIRM|nr:MULTISPECIES: polyribonucleotide nucleotidyltransferase [Dehalobacter]AHF09630.1 polyribonucleotide nucleotidyltransferase [Dehalobacter restrictus DSM 9455]MCG1026541.1 polyribonucleotide nucleotidyltransferase [Dehalobacter sp.]MDJ0304330.1 polyribonucleotide nucleotidyltransferase [Dehalobacter sp.]OCZ54968.1 polyribonucleotide nucleotidyltransferase [Dehalobacter sp. TeCB1]QHA00223.1 polyribonucleotide nucleotidyltransferase [Dehalobacter restrictus]
MTQEVLERSLQVGGRNLSFETGIIGRQAGGAIYARYGDTVISAFATTSSKPREGIDFFPLTVDLEERFYAVGKIPGGFIKREGRPSERSILSSRLIDRPVRPLFPDGYRNDVQISAMVMSVDQDCAPDVTAINAVSAALTISDIPFLGPIAAVVVGLVDGEFVVNPTVAQAEISKMQLTVAGTKDAIMMVEAGAKEVPEDQMLEAIMFAHEEIKKIAEFIERYREAALEVGLAKAKREVTPVEIPAEISEKVLAWGHDKLDQAIRIEEKLARQEAVDKVKADALEVFAEEFPEDLKLVTKILDDLTHKIIRKLITHEHIRPDGRALDEIRPITIEVGRLPRTHGTGLFTRGQTQVLTVATLGAAGDEQIIDGLGLEDSKRYMHHYNFPAFSVGEVRPNRGPGRREIGHGALAERALLPMIPPESEFPYTLRLVSEVLESNGSSSMASVCGSTLALMDAGVPIKAPVAGIAMGLIKEEDHFAILTDIQGLEDHDGDMDFKVAGTAEGITALQMDIKIKGVNREILAQALAQAKAGRMFILDKMLQVLPQPRPNLSPFAPRIITFTIHPDKIRDVIGPGGKIIKKIVEETKVKIDIEDDGQVFIAAVDGEAGDKAAEIIRSLTRDIEVGKIYKGKVVRIMDFGAFVEVIPGVLGLPGKDGLVHISQLDVNRVNKVEDVVKLGDEIIVKATGIDKQGRLNLSRKEALGQSQGQKE